MKAKNQITIKAMCLFQNNGKILVTKGFDDVKNKHFYRVVGGTVEFSETAEQGIRREVQEELNSDLENLELVDVIENIFTFQDKQGHEIVFLYIGELTRKELYEQKIVRIIEPTYEIEAEWIVLDDIIAGKVPLYPKFDYKKVLEKDK